LEGTESAFIIYPRLIRRIRFKCFQEAVIVKYLKYQEKPAPQAIKLFEGGW
jgi:hypothetical protein